MKAVLGIGFLFAAVLCLTAWIDSTSPSAAAVGAASSDPRNQQILERSNEAMNRMQSSEAELDLVMRVAGQQILMRQSLLIKTPQRIYAQSVVLGQRVEVFTNGWKTCARMGGVWTPFVQPLAPPNQEVAMPRSLQRHADQVLDGVLVYHFSGTLSAEDIEQLVRQTNSNSGTISDINAEYFIGKHDFIVRKMKMTFAVTARGQRADAEMLLVYKHINEPVKVPETIPLTCDPARTF